MRSFRRFTSGESQAAAARFPDFLLAMASPLKKSLRAAERKRADVARARRRWIREQGFLDPAHLVFIDETAAPPTCCGSTVGTHAASAWSAMPRWDTGIR